MVATLEPPELVKNRVAGVAEPSPSRSGDLPPRSSSGPRFNIGRDIVARATAGLPNEQREAIEWLWKYANDRNLGREPLGALLLKKNNEFYSADSVYQLLTGRRSQAGFSVEPMVRAIITFRRKIDPIVTRSETFIETQFAQKIWAYCRRAQKSRRVGFIFGDMSIGKSFALEELARRDHRFIYTRMPTRGHLNEYLSSVAPSMGMGDRQTVHNTYLRYINALKSPDTDDPRQRKVLIVDEADQCFFSVRTVLGMSTLDYLREVKDRSGCSLVLVMDHHGRDQLMAGVHSKRLKRLWSRRLKPMQLKSRISEDDMAAFAKAYGLPPAPERKIRITLGDNDEHSDSPARLQADVIENEGLGVWTEILREAFENMKAAGKTLNWGGVIRSYTEFVAEEA